LRYVTLVRYVLRLFIYVTFARFTVAFTHTDTLCTRCLPRCVYCLGYVSHRFARCAFTRVTPHTRCAFTGLPLPVYVLPFFPATYAFYLGLPFGYRFTIAVWTTHPHIAFPPVASRFTFTIDLFTFSFTVGLSRATRSVDLLIPPFCPVMRFPILAVYVCVTFARYTCYTPYAHTRSTLSFALLLLFPDSVALLIHVSVDSRFTTRLVVLRCVPDFTFALRFCYAHVAFVHVTFWCTFIPDTFTVPVRLHFVSICYCFTRLRVCYTLLLVLPRCYRLPQFVYATRSLVCSPLHRSPFTFAVCRVHVPVRYVYRLRTLRLFVCFTTRLRVLPFVGLAFRYAVLVRITLGHAPGLRARLHCTYVARAFGLGYATAVTADALRTRFTVLRTLLHVTYTFGSGYRFTHTHTLYATRFTLPGHTRVPGSRTHFHVTFPSGPRTVHRIIYVYALHRARFAVLVTRYHITHTAWLPGYVGLRCTRGLVPHGLRFTHTRCYTWLPHTVTPRSHCVGLRSARLVAAHVCVWFATRVVTLVHVCVRLRTHTPLPRSRSHTLVYVLPHAFYVVYYTRSGFTLHIFPIVYLLRYAYVTHVWLRSFYVLRLDFTRLRTHCLPLTSFTRYVYTFPRLHGLRLCVGCTGLGLGRTRFRLRYVCVCHTLPFAFAFGSVYRSLHWLRARCTHVRLPLSFAVLRSHTHIHRTTGFVPHRFALHTRTHTLRFCHTLRTARLRFAVRWITRSAALRFAFTLYVALRSRLLRLRFFTTFGFADCRCSCGYDFRVRFTPI